jgi:hypothetical protein
VRLAGEPADVAHDPHQLRRQDGPDPEDLGERGVPAASTSSRMRSSSEATFRSMARTSRTNSEANRLRTRPVS